jgi:TetR/AcrR family transcriptional regulator, transcriptional repressor for nem operon
MYSKGSKNILSEVKMRKSRAEAAETRTRILSTAAKMFLDKGLGTVGMRDVMAGASLAPGGFYRHFQSKDRLIAEASRAAFDRAFATLESATVGKSPTQAIERIVSAYLGQSQGKEKPYQCPLALLGSELRHSDPEVRTIAINGYQRIVELIADHLTHRTRREALVIASGIVSTIVGAVTLAEIAPDAATANAILSNARVLIKEHILRPQVRRLKTALGSESRTRGLNRG